MSPQQPESVSSESAYRAAVTRAQRTTEALIVAEAQILERDQIIREQEAAILRLTRELKQYQDAEADTVAADPQCQHWESGSPCDWNVCRQRGGGDDGPNEGRDDPASEREAVHPHPFSD